MAIPSAILTSACAANGNSQQASEGHSQAIIEQRVQFASGELDQFSDETLMTAFGSEIRKAYRTGDGSVVRTREFLELVQVLERRRRISKKITQQIQLGIVFVGMPLDQALASIDGLVEVDTLTIDRHLIRSFRGPTSAALGSRTSYDTFIACDGVIVTFFAAKGLITRDTIRRTIGSGGIRFQTNFPPGFWDPANFEARIRANRVMESPRYLADRREHRWSLFSSNNGSFVKPSVWQETGATSYSPRPRGRDINDMMNLHIRRGGSVC